MNQFQLRPDNDGNFSGFHIVDNKAKDTKTGFVEASVFFQDEDLGSLCQFSFIRSSLMTKDSAEDMISCLREAYKLRFGTYPQNRKPKLEKKKKD
jgi:hypothetical protein